MTTLIVWSKDKRRQRCPQCGKHDRDKTLGVTIDDKGGRAHCFRCNFVEFSGGPAAASSVDSSSQPAPEQRHETLSDFGKVLWRSCRRIDGDAAAYLQARCCVIPPADGALRWHPAFRHPPSGMLAPALIALVTDVQTGEPLTLHRTWIKADGSKAAVDPPRMLLGGHRKAGGVIRLWPDESVTTGLAIAEGIETALSLARAFTPVWACVDASNLAAFPVLDGIEALTIAADHDDAGIQSAEACARRWVQAGREVRVVKADKHKADINDLARRAA